MTTPLPSCGTFDDTAFLLARLKQKDRDAFGYLLDKYSGALNAQAGEWIECPEDREKILEGALRVIWSRIGDFEALKGSIYCWMLAILRDECRQHLSASETRSAQNENENLVRIDGLKMLVRHLTEPCRTVIMLSYFQNQSDDDIALVTGQSAESVMQLKRAGLIILHKMISVATEIKKPSHISERVLA